MNRVFVLVNADHLSVSTTELASLPATNSSELLFAHRFIMKLHLETAIVYAREHS